MRPLRSISRKNSIQKSLDTSAESRLLSSFSKLANKNNEKQSTINFSQISMELYPSQSGKLIKQRQSYNNSSCQSSLFSSLSNSPKIKRISMTTQQKLQQKQNTIEHLKIELQQSRYIISSLKQQIKQLNLQLAELKKPPVIIECKNCSLMESKISELEFLKAKLLKDDEFLETYEELIQKLTTKITQLECQNNNLKTKTHNKNIHNNLLIQTNYDDSKIQKTQQPLKQNKNIFNTIQLNDQSQHFNQSKCSFDLRLQSNQKKSSFKQNNPSFKQNHPCTPKNNLPLSLSKNKLSGFKSNPFSSEKQIQNQQKNIQQPFKSQKQKENRSKIGFSPQKLKQKLIGRNDRKSMNFINQNLIQSQNGAFDLKVMSKLDKKIYF